MFGTVNDNIGWSFLYTLCKAFHETKETILITAVVTNYIGNEFHDIELFTIATGFYGIIFMEILKNCHYLVSTKFMGINFEH